MTSGFFIIKLIKILWKGKKVTKKIQRALSNVAAGKHMLSLMPTPVSTFIHKIGDFSFLRYHRHIFMYRDARDAYQY